MPPRSALLLPPRPLSGCVFAAIVRDTRGTNLSDKERFNHFPASPLVSVTRIVEGTLWLGKTQESVLPPLSVLQPQDSPTTSWSPGPVAAITVGFYPDAWALLCGDGPRDQLPPPLSGVFDLFTNLSAPEEDWASFCTILSDIWQETRMTTAGPDWAGSRMLSDWMQALLARAALAGPGRSMRAMERRLRRWSGQSRQTLNFFADFEHLHRLSVRSPDQSLAALAADAGYADQSHMGRAVRRATGFSPARLNRLIETHESFWCYRLLGERF